jgi:hypothetical protein
VHVPLAGRIEAVRRLVEHQQPRPGQQRGGKAETLSHPEREAADAVVGHVCEPDLPQHITDPVGAVPAQTGQRCEVLPSGERRIQPRPIHEPRDVVDDLQLTAVGAGQPEQQAQQRRLPGPVRADQAVDLALRDVEVDAVEGDDLAEGLADPARANRKLRRPAGCPAGRRVATPLRGTGQCASGLGM